MSLHLSKCHIVGNHMPRLILFLARKRQGLCLKKMMFCYFIFWDRKRQGPCLKKMIFCYFIFG